MHASHVVVDERDGCTYSGHSDGTLFDETSATMFASERNRELAFDYQTSYQVYELRPQKRTFPY